MRGEQIARRQRADVLRRDRREDMPDLERPVATRVSSATHEPIREFQMELLERVIPLNGSFYVELGGFAAAEPSSSSASRALP